jgi:hypothetical protein
VVPYVTPTPAGKTFQGVSFNTSLNNRGDLVFTGIVKTDKGIHVSGQDYIGVGQGLFKADENDQIASIVSPGDPALEAVRSIWPALMVVGSIRPAMLLLQPM